MADFQLPIVDLKAFDKRNPKSAIENCLEVLNVSRRTTGAANVTKKLRLLGGKFGSATDVVGKGMTLDDKSWRGQPTFPTTRLL